MKISSSLLLTILLIGVVSGQQLPSVVAESSYCNLVSLTTPELVLDIEQNLSAKSSYQIKLTQHYEVSNTTIALAYIQSQQDLMLQSTTSKLISTMYTENVSNELVFIDAKNEYILAIEIIDQTNNFFDYVLLKANLDSTNTNNIMTKFTLISDNTTNSTSNTTNSTSNTTNSTSNTTDSMIISDIISIDSSWMYFLVKKGSVQQSLYKLDLTKLQTGDTSKTLLLVANINQADKPVNIIGGNIYHLYDRNTMQFY